MVKKKICGVYKIVNLVNGKCYYGGSIDISGRWYEHNRTLTNSSHANPHLQRAWDKYGEENFTFEIVEKTSKDGVFPREQWYLDNVVRWGIDYNIGKNSFNPMLGRTHSDETRELISFKAKGRKASKETKKKMSKSQKGLRAGELHWMWGRKGDACPNWGKVRTQETKDKIAKSRKGIITHSEETKLEMSKNRQGEMSNGSKLKEWEVTKIRRLYATGEYTQKQLSKMFVVNSRSISSIVNYKTWKNVK